MSFLAAVRVALDTLWVNRGRSILTGLGIIIGLSAVIATVSAASGARRQLDDRLDSFGKGLILIRSGARSRAGIMVETPPLTRADAEAIRRQVGPLLNGVAESQTTQRPVAAAAGQWGTAIVGSVPDLVRVRRWHMLHGRFYDDDEVRRSALVCLLGQSVRQRLFPDKPNPVGAWLRVGGCRLRIIGVMDAKGRSPTGADQDDQIFVPITTLQRHIAGKERIDLIVAAARSEDRIAEAEREIRQVLRRQHRLSAETPDDFNVSSVQEIAELAEFLSATMQALIAVVAAISLLVGGIGIMNIMLVSVTERTREIGIRMAVGASPGNILVQFLIEAVILALTGGLLGLLVGVLVAVAVAQLAGWPLVISPELVAMAFVLSAAIGIFFGYYPAWKASRLDPIEALRYE